MMRDHRVTYCYLVETVTKVVDYLRGLQEQKTVYRQLPLQALEEDEVRRTELGKSGLIER